MLLTKLQKLYKTSTSVDYCHAAITFLLAIFVIVNQDMSEFVNMLPLGFRLEAQADSPGTALILRGWPTATDKTSEVERVTFNEALSFCFSLIPMYVSSVWFEVKLKIRDIAYLSQRGIQIFIH